MTDILDQDARRASDRAERARAKRASRQFRADVQSVLGTVSGRRVVFAFLQTAGVDSSAYRNNPGAMAHAIGWQDAANWWIEQIRQHCPEREGQMRQEALADSRITDEAPNDE